MYDVNLIELNRPYSSAIEIDLMVASKCRVRNRKSQKLKNNSHTMSTGEQIKKFKPLKIQTAKHNHGYSRCFANE